MISKLTDHVPLSIKCFDLAKYMYLELCINNISYHELDFLAIILKCTFKEFKYMTQIVLYFSSFPQIILHVLLCAFLSFYNKSFSKKAILTLGGCKEIAHFYNLLSVCKSGC